MATARLANITIAGTSITTVGALTSTVATLNLNAPGFCGSVDNATIHVVGYLIGTDGTNSCSAQISRAFKRISGTLTALGAGVTNIVPMQGDVAITGSVGLLTASGTTIQLQATGVALITITWQGYLNVWSNDFTG